MMLSSAISLVITVSPHSLLMAGYSVIYNKLSSEREEREGEGGGTASPTPGTGRTAGHDASWLTSYYFIQPASPLLCLLQHKYLPVISLLLVAEMFRVVIRSSSTAPHKRYLTSDLNLNSKLKMYLIRLEMKIIWTLKIVQVSPGQTRH